MQPVRKIESNGLLATARCSDPPPPGLIEGIDLYNRGEFFECHEVLELIWRDESDPVRELYHGILQVGVAFHHWQRGNFHGSVTLLGRGVRRLSRLPAICMTIDVAGFRDGANRCLGEIERLGADHLSAFDSSRIPKVEFVHPTVETTSELPPDNLPPNSERSP